MTKRYAPSEHRATLGRLSEAPAPRRLFFALWCQEALWLRGGRVLLARFSAQDAKALVDAREAMWREALGGPFAAVRADVLRVLQDFSVHEDDFSGEVRCASDLADLLELTAQETGWTEAAIRAGIVTVHQIFYFLQEIAADKDSDSSPLVLREVSRQSVMIDALLQGPPTPEMRHSGREVSLFARNEHEGDDL